MNQVKFFIYRVLLLVVCVNYSNVINAYDFEVDGLYYNILSNNQVEVTCKKKNDMGYSGKLEIPEKVKYAGKEYIVTSIGDWAFWYCDGITGSLNLPNTITKIGMSAFQECKNLTGELKIPKSVKTIGVSAFAGCIGFTGSLIIPSSVTAIGDCAFGGCTSLTGTLNIPNSVVRIGESAFIGCSGFSGLNLPNSLTEIADWAFNSCRGLTGTLTIPNSVKKIGSNAFGECEGLTGSLTIPKSVTDIGENAFSSCTGFSGVLVIPNSVTSIGGEAFWNCNGFIGTLTIPNSVTTIGGAAFAGCKGFTGALVIPNSVTIIENGAFSSCEGLESLTIHDKVESIKEYAFNGCKGLTGVLTIPGSVKSIDNGAFTNCSSLSTLSISNGVTSIGNNAFKYCSGLTSVLIPNSVISIGISAFESCWNLTKLVIPKDVNSIGYSAFYNCSSLKNVESNIINPYNIDNRVFKGISSTAKLMVPKGTRSKYEVLSGWTNNFKEISEIGAITSYTLSITASGSGSASYGGTTVRGTTKSFPVNEGTKATITFTPDAGYRIKSLKVNGSAKTASSSYDVTVNADTSVEVEFEAIPVTTYTLSIKATGSGSASYGGTTVRGTTKSFSVNEGTKATITFTPDAGYRTKSLKVNGSAKTASTSYKVTVNADTSVEVEFEAIPVTNYTLSIKATGSGSASYSGSTIKGTTKSFTLNEGTKATITFTPDAGYQIAKVKVNSSDVNSKLSNNQYTVTVNSNTSVEVEFGKVADSEHSIDGHEYVDLGLPSGAYWSVVNYGAEKPEEAGTFLEWSLLDRVKNDWGQYWKTPTKEDMQELIDVCEWTWTELNGIAGYSIKGPNGNMMFLPAAGGRDDFGSYKYGEMAYYFTESRDELFTSEYWIFQGDSSERKMRERVVIDYYPVRPISTVRNESVFSVDGLNFTVVSANEKTANLAKGNYGKVLEVPSEVIYPNTAWKVVGIDKGALDDCKKLSAIIWNPDAAFTEVVDNPNFLLYVKDAKYAPASIKNVVVNGTANSIVLSEALYNNDFYCPLEFTAKSIAYTHNYKMETGLGISKGWETIALPFDVQKISHESKGEITPFVNWKSGDAKKPFWLKTYGDRGWTDASGIKANTPYIISMPNNSKYKPEYRLSGKVTFSAENVVIPVSDNLHIVNYNGKYLVPNFVSGNHEYALNVKSDFVSYTGNEVEGSVFLYNLRVVHPFEAYMKTSSGGTRSIAISDDLTTGIEGIPVLDSDDNTLKVYDLNGKLLVVERGKSIDDVKHLLPAGVYIINGKKLMIK